MSPTVWGLRLTDFPPTKHQKLARITLERLNIFNIICLKVHNRTSIIFLEVTMGVVRCVYFTWAAESIHEMITRNSPWGVLFVPTLSNFSLSTKQIITNMTNFYFTSVLCNGFSPTKKLQERPSVVSHFRLS